MIELAHKTAEGELSVRQVEAIARREGKQDEEKKTVKQKLTYYTEVEVSLGEILGTKVKINEGKKENVLQIKFKDKDELENILSRFQDD